MYKLEVLFFTCVLPKIVTLSFRDDNNFWSGIAWWCRGVILCFWYAELLSFRYNSRVPRLVYLNPDCMLFSNKYDTPITVLSDMIETIETKDVENVLEKPYWKGREKACSNGSEMNYFYIDFWYF